MLLFLFLQMCNEWAIDTPCPVGGRDFCRSLHILDSRGNSVLVSKSCASNEECGPASVGCIPMDTQQVRNSEFCYVPGGKDKRKQRNENAKKNNIETQERNTDRTGCCDLSYCNIESPTNATNAIYSRQRRAKSKSKRKRPGRNGVDAATRLYGSSLLWLPASLFYAYHC
ncbi:hypothetical protein ALC53_08650 [Atta colombica]|uniref:Uncharacterized protein n=1 Tax=Atta colombica TaxID=520822 RepID=A0A151I2B9_9HYME|nr:hypothetical protein ALC53_08650 [Atta colombica]